MIHVITAVHNRRAITEKFVESLLSQTYREIHLLLVDDGSSDGTDQMVRERFPRSTILYGDGNLWWGGALQLAFQWLMEHAEGEDSVLLTNDDTCYEENYIETGVRLLQEYPQTLVAGSGYGLKSGRHLDGIFAHSFRDGTGQLLPPDSEGNCASTRSLFLTVEMWRRTGGMHPFLLPHYFADFELTIRAWRKGMKIRSFGQLRYTFDEGATGDNRYEELTVKKLFGKRSGCNPLYRLSFILLSTPPRYLPGHLWHQMIRYIKKAGTFFRILKNRH